MTTVARIRGIPSLIRKLKVRTDQEMRAVMAGLFTGGLFLQRESQKIVPVQYGNLKGSATTRKMLQVGSKGEVRVGYTADYAVYVHENRDAAHGQDFNVKYAEKIAHYRSKPKAIRLRSGYFKRGPAQQYKFLERPAREKRKEIAAIVFRVAQSRL